MTSASRTPRNEVRWLRDTRLVTIPASIQHEGFFSLTVKLPWVCLTCNGPRGEPYDTLSYDGSRRLAVHGWTNPCGHVELYSEVRAAWQKAKETA